jgi:glycolate oxidase
MDFLKALKSSGITYLIDKPQMLPYINDASYFHGNFPLSVIMPSNEKELSIALELCDKFNIKIVPRGGGSSLTGSSVAIDNSVVISLLKMNKIIEFSGGNRYVKVQAGLRIDDLNAFLKEKGFIYPPDPASSLAATVGGTISTNAGGLKGTYFGSTKEWILGLGVTLPNGKIIRTGGKVLKRSLGYDLTSLFIGSEGTLGIIFEAYLKIVPDIKKYSRIIAYFQRSEDLGDSIFDIKNNGFNPLTAEFADKVSSNVISKLSGIKLPENTNYMLITDIPEFEDEESIVNIIKSHNPVDISKLDRYLADRIYKARKGLYSALLNEREKETDYVIIADIVVPSSNVSKALETIESLIKETGLKTALFGHIGDGNIHANVFTDLYDQEKMRKTNTFLDRFGEIALQNGGSVSAEHGIGYEKKDLLIKEMVYRDTPLNLELMRDIKKMFDPKNIMNPGKVFDL